MAVERKYLAKIYRNGTFLGVLQNIKSEFSYSQNINTGGTQLSLKVGYSAARARDQVDYLMTEDGDFLITEDGDFLVTERTDPLVGNDSEKALIRNNNDIKIYEFSSYNPNGLLVFSGFISKWKAAFGNNNDVDVTVLSYGRDLDNFLIQGNTTIDQTQTSNDTDGFLTEPSGDKGAGWNRWGQTFTVGVGVTNIASIILKCRVDSGSETFTLKLWNSVSDFFTGSPLGTAELTVTETSNTDRTFAFSSPVAVVAGQQYFFSIQGTNGYVRYYNSDNYAGGVNYNSNYGGGSGGGSWGPMIPAGDLYFKTQYTSLATDTPFSSEDPATIANTIVSNFHNQGSVINIGSVDLTGTTQSYTFKLNTVLEGIKKCLELSPYNWYWYIDPATSSFYFKQTGTTADHIMVLGRHIQSLEIEATIEQVKNLVYFSGGDTGSGDNLFTSDSDSASITNYRQGLARISDNRVTTSPTADAIMENFLNNNAAENYITQITIEAANYNIALFKWGQIIGFGGFGNFVDRLLLQIVGINRKSTSVTLSLGLLPKRATKTIEELLRAINDLQTVDNPSTPS